MGSTMLNHEDKVVFSTKDAIGERNIVAQFDLPDDDAVHAVAWSPDGNLLLVTSKQGSFASVYDMQTNKLSATMPISEHGVAASDAILYNDGSFIAPTSGISSNRSPVTSALTHFDQSGKTIGSVMPPGEGSKFRDLNILRLSSSSSGTILSFTGVDTTAKTRGLPLYEQWPAMIMAIAPDRVLATSKTIVGDAAQTVRDVSLSANGEWASAINNRGHVRIWSRSRDAFVADLDICGRSPNLCQISKISNNGRYIVIYSQTAKGMSQSGQNYSVNGSGLLSIWSISRNTVAGILQNEEHSSATSISKAYWAPDDKEVAVADTASFSIWALDSGKPKLTFNRTIPRNNDGRAAYALNGLSYSGRGMLAVTAGNHVIIYK